MSNPKNKSQNDFAINYGVTDALAPFPLHSLVSVMSCTINNKTVNLNVQESLPTLLRMVDPEEFSKYDSMTPTDLDFLANYEDAVKRQEFQIVATAASAAAPRPIVYYPGNQEVPPAADANFNGARPFSYTSYQNNVLAYDMNRPAGTAYYHKPRGSWTVNRIYAPAGHAFRY